MNNSKMTNMLDTCENVSIE